MPQYVLVNRRSGMFTNSAKTASRATVSSTLGMLTSARVVADHQPNDPLARQVVLLRCRRYPGGGTARHVARRFHP